MHIKYDLSYFYTFLFIFSFRLPIQIEDSIQLSMYIIYKLFRYLQYIFSKA